MQPAIKTLLYPLLTTLVVLSACGKKEDKFDGQYDDEGYPTGKGTICQWLFTGADLYRTKIISTY